MTEEEFRRKLKVEKISDTVVEKAGEEEAEELRTVSLKAEGISVAIKGDPEELLSFTVGDSVEMYIKTARQGLT